MNLQGFGLFIIAALCCQATVSQGRTASPHCNGTANLYGAYDDQQIVQLTVNGTNNEVTGATIISSTSSGQGGLYTKGNGVTVNHVENRFHFFSGITSVKILDVETKEWISVDVANCQPVGVAQHGPDIIGYCKLNTTRLPLCVQYFRLYQRNGKWTYTSRPGLCSYSLSTTSITNSVILQYISQYGFATKLYFAEEGTNRLHEIDLGQQETAYYDVPDHQGNVMKISRIVPTVANSNDGNFVGLRLELVTDNSPGVVYHKEFSSIDRHFLRKFVQTESIAFDSYDLSYLVSFSMNHKTMNIMFKNGSGILQYTLATTLDNTIQCENMAEPFIHHLICLAGNGFSPILINVLNGTSHVIPIKDSPIVDLGALNRNTVYFLNAQQVLSFYVLDNSTALRVGDYTIRHSTSLRLFNFNSSLSCINHQSTDNSNSSSGTNNVVYIIIFLPMACVITGAIIITILVMGRHACLVELKKKSSEINVSVKSLQLINAPSTSTISESPETVHTPKQDNHDVERAPGNDICIPETPPVQATTNTGGIMAHRPFNIPELEFPPARIGNQQPTPNSEFVEAPTMTSAKSCTSINRDPLTDVPRVPPEGKQ